MPKVPRCQEVVIYYHLPSSKSRNELCMSLELQKFRRNLPYFLSKIFGCSSNRKFLWSWTIFLQKIADNLVIFPYGFWKNLASLLGLTFSWIWYISSLIWLQVDWNLQMIIAFSRGHLQLDWGHNFVSLNFHHLKSSTWISVSHKEFNKTWQKFCATCQSSIYSHLEFLYGILRIFFCISQSITAHSTRSRSQKNLLPNIMYRPPRYPNVHSSIPQLFRHCYSFGSKLNLIRMKKNIHNKWYSWRLC